MNSKWYYSTLHNSHCQIIEEQTLWGQTVCRVWLPNQDTVVRVPQSALRPLDSGLQPDIEAHRIHYLAAAAKVAEVLEGSTDAQEGHILLAPMESNVIPLPHQIHALSRIMSGDRIRYLLADEVGLGKTVEAGLVMRELKLRGLVRRTLVVAPKGLASQWVAEMQTHFNETFQLVLGEDIASMQRFATSGANRHRSPWEMFDQVIVSLDSVKPMGKRRGWSQERIDAYNQQRFEDLTSAGWDLVIVDEAHRLGGSTDQVARYKLGQGLAEAAPYCLLLSATPHQGKSDAFFRLMSLLDGLAFPDETSITRERVMPYVVRTEKRKALNAEGNALFKPRITRMVPVKWEPRHHLQRLLYEAVTDYVREGYNQALQAKQRHIGFLMILMQRLVVSSTRAIRTTLERRLEALTAAQTKANPAQAVLEDSDEEQLYDMDGQALLDELLQLQLTALQNEQSHVEALLDAARRCEQAGADAKAEALLDWIYRLQAEENEPDLKVLIFTEFVPTQQMLKTFLEERGIAVATLNGSMGMDERKAAQDAFRHTVRVLVSTDAGGEGLNLQFSHVIINYDIPWNPMRLEQRIGRVDRIGQPKVVRAINFVFEDSVEFRVREVLEQKLAVIFDELGIDKAGDVLDSAQAGELFEEVFATAFLNPDQVDNTLTVAVGKIREEIHEIREAATVYGMTETPDVQAAERLRTHPLPHWVERMTVAYLHAHGGKAVRKRGYWELVWPDDNQPRKCVFSIQDSGYAAATELCNLENNRIRGLALSLGQVVAGQPIPQVALADLPANLRGWWGLFEIRLQASQLHQSHLIRIPAVRKRYLSVFLTPEGKLYLPTARHIWDALQTSQLDVTGFASVPVSSTAHEQLHSAAEQAGQSLFDSLLQAHQTALTGEQERGNTAFTSRRKAITRLGLPEVRQFRLSHCDADESEWQQALASAQQITPEIRPLLLMQIGGQDKHE